MDCFRGFHAWQFGRSGGGRLVKAMGRGAGKGARAISLHAERLFLAAIIILASVLSLRGIDFGLPALNDPDELMFELGAVRMLRDGTLNPGWFGHPATTTMYFLAIINALVFVFGHLLGFFGSAREFGEAIYANPSLIMLPGRVAMALFATGTVFLVWRLGKALFGQTGGLVAALLLAVNPIHITYAQVIRSDMMACFFMMLVLLTGVRIARDGKWRDYVAAAFWLAMVMATKWPFALCALSIAGAVGLRVLDAVQRGDRHVVRKEMLRLVFFGLMSIGFLLIISPYLVLDFKTVVRNVAGEAQPFHLGATAGTPLYNLHWYLSKPVLQGFGVAGLCLVVVGLIGWGRRREVAAMLVPLMIAWLLLISFQNLIWERWALPLMPILALCASPALAWLIFYARERFSGFVGGTFIAALLVGVCAPILVNAETALRVRTHDTRQIASQWALKHIPAGSTVLIEHFAFDLVNAPWGFRFPLAEAGCVDARAMLKGKIAYAEVDGARGARHNVDYGTMPESRRAECRFDYAILSQMDRYFAESGRFPVESKAYRDLVAQGQVVASFEPQPGQSGRWIVRIVRMNPMTENLVRGSSEKSQ
jgi:hypothetical protein